MVYAVSSLGCVSQVAFVLALKQRNLQQPTMQHCLEGALKPGVYYVTGGMMFSKLVSERIVKVGGTVFNTYKATDYSCSNYYPMLGDLVLNSDYSIIPRSQLRFSERMFVRPDSSEKEFNGNAYSLASDVSNLEIPVLVSSPKDIKMEVRCIVGDGKMLTASAYGRQPWEVQEYSDVAMEEVVLEAVARCPFIHGGIACVDMAKCEGRWLVNEITPSMGASIFKSDSHKIIDYLEKK